MSILLLIPVLLLAWFCWEKRQRRTQAMAGGIHRDITLHHDHEFELYHNDLSLCSKKVRVCMAELGLSYKSHHIELIETGYYETLGRRFLKVNPSGIVPVLVHNGHPIYESHDIISYAADRCPDPEKQLLPQDPDELEVMQHWKDLASIFGDDPANDLSSSAAACAAVLTVPLFSAGIERIPYYRIFEGILFHRLRSRAVLFLAMKLLGLGRLARTKEVMAKLDSAKVAFGGHLQSLEQLLEDGRPFITGTQFTLADVSWMVLFDRLLEADWYDYFLGGNDFPYVQAYWERLRERPSHREAVDGFRHPLVTAATLRVQQQKVSDSVFREAMYGNHLCQ